MTMVTQFTNILAHAIEAKDGELGRITDILIDDQTWAVRYAVVDTAHWLPGRKVLIAPACFNVQGLTAEGHLKVDLTQEQVKNSPPLETDLPVSQQHERALHDYYGWIPYWSRPLAPVGFPYPDLETAGGAALAWPADWPDIEAARRDRFDGHLHSCSAIVGCKISTRDDQRFGEVKDLILDTSEWLVIDLLLGSRRWLPGGKEFVCSPLFVSDIDYGDELLVLSQRKDTLLESPDFDPHHYGAEYRKILLKYYCERYEARSSPHGLISEESYPHKNAL